MQCNRCSPARCWCNAEAPKFNAQRALLINAVVLRSLEEPALPASEAQLQPEELYRARCQYKVEEIHVCDGMAVCDHFLHCQILPGGITGNSLLFITAFLGWQLLGQLSDLWSAKLLV